MSIINAIKRAYEVNKQRNWTTVYWAIGLHGVCLNSNYDNGNYSFINEDVLEGLRAISNQKDSKIIIWSSWHEFEQPDIIKFFNMYGIRVDYFNKNPEIGNTKTGNFDSKFYFSILLDDKAGFNPDTDWVKIKNYLKNKRA